VTISKAERIERKAVAKKMIHLTASIAVLIHVQELIGIQDEPVPAISDIFVALTKANGIHRTGLLAEAAEDASKGIDLVSDRIPLAFFGFTNFQIDALGRTDGDAQAAGHAGGFSLLVLVEVVHSSPALRDGLLLFGIAYGDWF
jgi:hypothetical protein